MRPLTRRTALLGTAGLLAGCETIDNIFGERRDRFEGERRSVLEVPERVLSADDAAAASQVILPAPAPRDAWPMAGGDAAHSGGHVAFGPGLGRAWSSGFGSGSAYRRRLTSGPVAGNGVAFVSDAFGEVSAFDLRTGGRRWRRDTARRRDSDGTMGAGLALAGETLFATTGLSEAMALDAATGEVRWRVDLPAPARGAPTVAGGRLLVPTVASQLLSLSVEDGSRSWTHRATAVTTIPLGLGAPAVEGDVVVAGFPSGELFALRISDGRVLWSESLAAAGTGALSDIAGVRAGTGKRRDRGCLDRRRLGLRVERCRAGGGDRPRQRAGPLGHLAAPAATRQPPGREDRSFLPRARRGTPARRHEPRGTRLDRSGKRCRDGAHADAGGPAAAARAGRRPAPRRDRGRDARRALRRLAPRRTP